MKTVYLILGRDLTNLSIKREYDVTEDTFWRLRSRHIPKDQDHGYGAVVLYPDQVSTYVPQEDLDRFRWSIDSMQEDPGFEW